MEYWLYFFSLLDWRSAAAVVGEVLGFEGEAVAFLEEVVSFFFSVLTFLLVVLEGDVDEGEASRFLDVRTLLRGVSGSAFILTSSSLIVGVSSFFAASLPPRVERRVGVALVDSFFVFAVDARAAARFMAAAILSASSLQKKMLYGDTHWNKRVDAFWASADNSYCSGSRIVTTWGVP